MNCLTDRKNLVRTSGTPGCTRQVAWFRTTSDDKAMIDLVDLPGYGYAKRSKTERKHWGTLIEGYLMERPTLKGVVLLVDVRRGPEEDDLQLIQMLRDAPRISRPPLELTLVATKLDKLSNAAQKPTLLALKQQTDMPVLGFSSVSGQGKLPLWRRLRRIAGVATLEANA
jgi:GTP-binding protein